MAAFCFQGVSGNQSTEDLIKQPDFSDKIKQLLGSLQQTQNQGAPTPGSDLQSLDQHLHILHTCVSLLLILNSLSSSQPRFAGTQSKHDRHEQPEHAHADAHEWRLPAQ